MQVYVVEPHAQIPRCIDRMRDGTVKSDQSVKVAYFIISDSVDRTIGFQAAVSDISDGKHLESFRQLTVIIVTLDGINNYEY